MAVTFAQSPGFLFSGKNKLYFGQIFQNSDESTMTRPSSQIFLALPQQILARLLTTICTFFIWGIQWLQFVFLLEKKEEERCVQCVITLSPSSCYQSAGSLLRSYLFGGIISTQDFYLLQHLRHGQCRSAAQPLLLTGFPVQGYQYRPCLQPLIYCISWCFLRHFH